MRVGVHGAVVDDFGGAQGVDEELGRTVAAVVTVETPWVERVAGEVELERPAEQVVVVERACVEAAVVGVITVADDLPCVVDGHHLRSVAGLEEPHACGSGCVEERREHCSLVEAGDVDHFCHCIAFFSFGGIPKQHMLSVSFLSKSLDEIALRSSSV